VQSIYQIYVKVYTYKNVIIDWLIKIKYMINMFILY